MTTISAPIFRRPELLLHPNIPKPLHGCAPRVVLGDQWWNEHRQEAYRTNNYCCWACGVPRSDALVHQWLEAHEAYDFDYSRGRLTLLEIVALCHLCHNFIHSGRLSMLNSSGEVTDEFVDQVTKHGKAVTRGLKRPKATDPRNVAKWSDWRMVIEGRDYGPTTPSHAAWERGEWRNWKPTT